MTTWRPRPSAGGRIGLLASVLALLAALAAADWTAQQPISLAMFAGLLATIFGLVLTLVLATWTYGYYTLRYQLDDAGLTIDWLFAQERLPYRAIDAVYGGQRLADELRVRGIGWPGYYVGRGRARNLGVLRVFASTLARPELTIVLSELGGFALSPDATFRSELVQRLERARREPAAARVTVAARRRELARAFADRWLLPCALASVAMLLAMLGYLMERYPALPELVPLPADALAPVGGRPRFELFHLPGIGACLWLLDVALGIWVYQWEPLAARMLWAAPLLLQAVLVSAVLRIVG
jgi:hypothetical protein